MNEFEKYTAETFEKVVKLVNSKEPKNFGFSCEPGSPPHLHEMWRILEQWKIKNNEHEIDEIRKQMKEVEQ